MSFICVILSKCINICLRALRTVEAILTVQVPDNALVNTGDAGQQRGSQCRGLISTNTRRDYAFTDNE